MNDTIENEPRPAPRLARPPRKDVYLRVRISKADRLAIYQAASEHLTSVGGFVRGVMLDYIAKHPRGRRS